MQYDVVVVGFRLNASLKPAQALQRVLGLDAETSKELTRRFPANVLTGVSRSQADRVSQELTEIGAKVEVRESRVSLANEAVGGAGVPATAPLEAARPAARGAGLPALAAAPLEAARPAARGAGLPALAAAPLEAARPAARAERDEGNSGNYEIGEILAPLGRAAAAPAPAPAAQAATPVAKRASREELELALRERSQPDQPAGPELELDLGTPAVAPAPGKAPAAKPAVTDTGTAFAGMQNFGGGLDGFDEANAPQLQVDEEALRSIQRAREPTPEVVKPPAAVLQERIGSWASSAFAWGTALLSLLAVASITLLAVGYALDPDHLLRPIGLEDFPDGTKKALTDLFGK